ncbi:MAG: endonuclease [Psychroflexus sp.]|nr:endonuclease [Psychroflexus sp.]MDN6309807.1 endonuclease [Psychroflexus sp.]
MKYFLHIICLVFIGFQMHSQILINELDSDTESIDDKEFIELKTPYPNTPLDGYVLVLFNGSSSGGNSSYFALDLDGFVSDFNGLFVIGGPELNPSPQYFVPINTFQNGADAVGIYEGSSDDFPEYTLATTTDLIDALVYGTSDPDAVGLMNLLGITEQIDEDENNNKDFESIQRANDNSWFVATPTPREHNDGSGIDPIFIDLEVSDETLEEGDDFEMTFTASEVLNEDLVIDFTMTNGTFTTDDFIGDTSLTILNNTSSVSQNVSIVDDEEDEGDEILLINVTDLPAPYILNNNRVEIIIIDNDYVVEDYGTPLNPTYNLISSTASTDYYEELNGHAGEDLKSLITTLISDNETVRVHTYADIYTILDEADKSPLNSNKVWLIYTEQDKSKYLRQVGSESSGRWNREHVFPRSRGGFYSIEDDGIATGIDSYWTTNADSLRHGNSDAHHLRPALSAENSSRGNKNFGDYTGPDGNQGSFKGDVARAVLYMELRYNALSIVEGFPTTSDAGQLGDLQTLLEWHEQDPPDDYEMRRNNVIYNWQKNRNPLIDMPDLVDYIWGDKYGDTWYSTMSQDEFKTSKIQVYPNPNEGQIHILNLPDQVDLQVFSLTGQLLFSQKSFKENTLKLNLAKGVYVLKISSEEQSMTQKIIIE